MGIANKLIKYQFGGVLEQCVSSHLVFNKKNNCRFTFSYGSQNICLLSISYDHYFLRLKKVITDLSFLLNLLTE